MTDTATKFALLDWDDWWDTFTPVANEGTDVMFETHGDDLSLVRDVYDTEPGRVWTLVDTDAGTAIVSGFASINRIGYHITKHALKKGVHVEVIDTDMFDEGDYEIEPASNYVEKA